MRLEMLTGKIILVCSCVAFLAPVLVIGGSGQAACEYSKMSGQDLVRRLTDPQTRSQAFYELSKRSDKKKRAGSYEEFLEGHYDPEVIVCPQGEANGCLYVVLYGFLGRYESPLHDSYVVDRPEELFPPLHGLGGKQAVKEPAIAVFTSNGHMIEPFGGDNVLDQNDLIADINGDGWVERAGSMGCCVEGVTNSVDVFTVVSVREPPQVLLAVLFNWGTEDWGCRLTDADRDGVLEVECGPKVADGLKPKVTYTWDRASRAYVGPGGRDGDHFRRLSGDNVWDAFKVLKKSGLVYPADPDFIGESRQDVGVWGRVGKKKPGPNELSKPYVYRSLKGLSDADIVRYMGEGNKAWQLEAELTLKTHAPTNFWTMPPKLAALAYAEENRYPDHRARYRLAVDARDGLNPPDICTITFTDQSDASYNDVGRNYFLRVDPRRSYLAYARSWEGGAVFYNVIHNAPAFDFRFCELTYADARQIADTIWWLDRIRSRERDPSSVRYFGSLWSSADGRGTLTVRREDGSAALRLSETHWASHVSERWNAEFSPEVCLNLAAYLIEGEIIARLGERWSRFEPKHSQEILARGPGAPKYEADEVQRNLIWAGEFLDLFSPDQKAISFAIVRESAHAAGGFADTNQRVRLERVLKQLQALPKSSRTREQIEAEIEGLDKVKAVDPKYGDALKTKGKLYDELISLASDVGAESVERYVALALKKIRLADDAAALQKWACTKEDGCQWALQRLLEKERKRYVAALEWWLANSQEEWARQAYDAIAEVDSVRAGQIAGGVAPDKKGDLSVSAFARLKEAGSIPDEKKRVETLIGIVLDPKSGWDQRGEALELLVPAEQPMRYPGKAVDEALVKLFDPALADSTINFTRSRACRALARRGRLECFDQVMKALAAADMSDYEEILGPAVQLTQRAPGAFSKKLEAALKPELAVTGRSVNDIVRAVWAADLRGLQADVRLLATSGPDDYEDEHAGSYCSEAREVEGRCHLARQILALWNEEDLVTRCRLLIAFGYANKYDFVGEPKEERLARMKAELGDLARKLTSEQKQKVADFVAWCEVSQKENELCATGEGHVKMFTALVKSGLALP